MVEESSRLVLDITFHFRSALNDDNDVRDSEDKTHTHTKSDPGLFCILILLSSLMLDSSLLAELHRSISSFVRFRLHCFFK